MNWPLAAVIAVTVLVAIVLGATGNLPDGDAPVTPNQEESVAYKLAAIHGDLGEEAAFQAAIDCIMASGIEGAETEEQVGDTLYASWKASAQRESLLEWAQALC